MFCCRKDSSVPLDLLSPVVASQRQLGWCSQIGHLQHDARDLDPVVATLEECNSCWAGWIRESWGKRSRAQVSANMQETTATVYTRRKIKPSSPRAHPYSRLINHLRNPMPTILWCGAICKPVALSDRQNIAKRVCCRARILENIQ